MKSIPSNSINEKEEDEKAHLSEYNIRNYRMTNDLYYAFEAISAQQDKSSVSYLKELMKAAVQKYCDEKGVSPHGLMTDRRRERMQVIIAKKKGKRISQSV